MITDLATAGADVDILIVETSGGITPLQVFLWVVLPYVAIVVFVVGMILRYRHDKFGWTTRSSQIYGGKLLRVASPLFHIGLLAVIIGHIMGLLIPEDWTKKLGVPESLYHWSAVVLGLIAGACVFVGIVLLLYRRFTMRSVALATTGNDKFMYLFLVAAIGLGLLATLYGSGIFRPEFDYRSTVSVWFRSIFLLDPQPQLMAASPLAYQLHAIAGMLVFIIWPFTRLVHALSAPVGYLFRPYVVYRTRGSHDRGNRTPQRGWERVG